MSNKKSEKKRQQKELKTRLREEQTREKKKEFLLQNISEFSVISYKQELDRKKLLIEQSNSFIISLSLIITFLGIVLPLALKYTQDYKGLVFISFIVIVILLIVSFVCAITVQWRMKYKQFLSPYDFFNEVKNNYNNYKSTSDFYTKKISGYGDIVKTEIDNNNRRAILIMMCHILLLVAIGLIIISSLTIIGLEIS
jgi:hypothetical protein